MKEPFGLNMSYPNCKLFSVKEFTANLYVFKWVEVLCVYKLFVYFSAFSLKVIKVIFAILLTKAGIFVYEATHWCSDFS